jgi:hypothetical protein
MIFFLGGGEFEFKFQIELMKFKPYLKLEFEIQDKTYIKNKRQSAIKEMISLLIISQYHIIILKYTNKNKITITR